MRERLPIVLSTTALAVAVLGATPVGEAALDQIVPRNSVGTPQLRNGAVTNAKLAGSAVTGAKVRNRSLLAVDFRAGQLPAGPPGPTGPQGPAGPPGASGLQPVFTTGARNSVSYKALNATCPSGKLALGGGVAITPASAATAVAITSNYLSGTTTWATAARETSTFGGSWSLNAVVVCATVAAG
jgi:hypothetical protein